MNSSIGNEFRCYNCYKSCNWTHFFYFIQTITHLKLLLHILCATLIGLLYGDCGSNASKSIQNVGFLLIGVAYLWYTTVMPSVLKCKSSFLVIYFLELCKMIANFTLFVSPVPTELEIVRKETFNNWYKARTYFLATTLTTTPIHVMQRNSTNPIFKRQQFWDKFRKCSQFLFLCSSYY